MSGAPRGWSRPPQHALWSPALFCIVLHRFALIRCGLFCAAGCVVFRLLCCVPLRCAVMWCVLLDRFALCSFHTQTTSNMRIDHNIIVCNSSSAPAVNLHTKWSRRTMRKLRLEGARVCLPAPPSSPKGIPSWLGFLSWPAHLRYVQVFHPFPSHVFRVVARIAPPSVADIGQHFLVFFDIFTNY